MDAGRPGTPEDVRQLQQPILERSTAAEAGGEEEVGGWFEMNKCTECGDLLLECEWTWRESAKVCVLCIHLATQARVTLGASFGGAYVTGHAPKAVRSMPGTYTVSGMPGALLL